MRVDAAERVHASRISSTSDRSASSARRDASEPSDVRGLVLRFVDPHFRRQLGHAGRSDL